MRVRLAITTDRLIVLGVVVSLVVAACAAIDDSSTTPASSAPESAPAGPISITASSIPNSTTTTAAVTSTTTTTTIAPTTTVAPTVEVVTEVCTSLRTDGFETRRVIADALPSAFAAADGEGDGRAEVAAECGAELARLDGAVEIRNRLETIDMAEEDGLYAVSLTDFSCDAGTFEVTVTNDAAIPLGLHANFAMYLDGEEDDSFQSSDEPIVLWSIEPGASEVVGGRFTNVSTSQVDCSFEGQVFDADPSSADASLGGEPEYPELTGDDPSVWFPALADVEEAARRSGDIDLAAVTEDVRSMSYDEVALAISEGEAYPAIDIVEVCERGRSRPDDDHIGFVYIERFPDGTDDGRFAPGDTRLSHSLFRRGADGQWRWLSTARYFESPFSDDCGGVDPDL